MKYPLNTNYLDGDDQLSKEARLMKIEAENYLKRFKWCKSINRSELYLNLGKVVCVFLFEIDNAVEDDNFLWVIVGDLPYMYLDVFGPKSTVDVLEDYVSLSKDWIKAVKSGGNLKKCYPFDIRPSIDLAEMLEIRIKLLEHSFLKNIENVKLPEPLLSL